MVTLNKILDYVAMMMKSKGSKKGLTVGITVILFSLAFVPLTHGEVHKLSNANELVSVGWEIDGIEDTLHYNVELTKENIAKLRIIFDNLKIQLEIVQSSEETIEIFIGALAELDRLGLLPETMSIIDAQQLICNHIMEPRSSQLIRNSRFWVENDIDSNLLCHIAGNTTLTSFCNIFDDFLELLGCFVVLPVVIIGLFTMFIRKILNIFFDLKKPYLVSFGDWIQIGYAFYAVPSEGWIWTNGLLGVKNWTGRFFGNLVFPIPPSPGIFHFQGIRIRYGENCYFLGTALRAKMRLV